MKWIKASERIPEIKEGDFDRVHVRQISNGYKDCLSVKYLSIHPTWYEWLDETPSKEGEEEAVEILNWLAHINVNGYKGTEFSEIILVDGEYYYKLDEDGDQPITPQQLYKIFKQSKGTTG